MCTRAAPAAEFDHESVCQPGKKPKLVSALQTESSLTALSVEETDLPVHTTQQLGPGPGGSYYCANFETVLTTMLSSSPERHVINNEAVEAVERFMALPEPQRKLYVRLFLRKHQWIRAAKLSYKDIASDLEPILTGLVDEGFLVGEEQLIDPRELLNLLQLGELKTVCREMKLPASVVGSQKAKIVESLFRHSRQHRPLFGKATFLGAVVKRAKAALCRCVRVCEGPADVFSKLMLLFSLTDSSNYGAEEAGFSQIVFRMLQVDTGMLAFPEYQIKITRPLFATEEHFQKFYVATKEEQQLLLAMEDKDTASVEEAVKRGGAMLAVEVQELMASIGCEPMDNNDQPSTPDCARPATTYFLSDNDEKVSHSGSQCLPLYLRRFTGGWVYATILSHCVEYLEKQRKYEDANLVLKDLLAQNGFCTSSRGRWWDRLALNLEFHLGRKEECLEVISQALKDPTIHPARRLSLTQRAQKLCERNSRDSSQQRSKNKEGSNSRKRQRNSKRETFSAFKLSDFPEMDLLPVPEVTVTGRLLQNDIKPVYLASSRVGSTSSGQSMMGVEGYAAYHYSHTEGWPCALHAEGATFSAMFSLLMWKVIFSSGVPDVFRSPYQSGPLDLFSDLFYANRREKVEARLCWIRAASREDIGSAVEQSWEENYGKVCAGMNWELFPSLQDAKALSMCMGGTMLGHVCEKFARNFSRSGGGLPDLTLWDPEKGRCKFVEVKGPGDRLSHKQIIWLSDLARWQCEVEVCRVKAPRS